MSSARLTANTTATAVVTKSTQVGRYYIAADGSKTVVDQPHSVSVTVDTTTNLRSLQLIHISWTGAHPTGGIVGDPNSDRSLNQEYPMVLLECRGTDSATVPAAERVSPQTCWTQFADERFLGVSDPYPAWRADASAAPDERAATVGAPASPTPQCTDALQGVASQRWIPFVGADGTGYGGGPGGCQGIAPEAATANLSSLNLPSNETFGVTGLDGTGEAAFDVFTAEDHASLGCSQTVACSLVAVPMDGLNCDPYGTLLPTGQQPNPTDAADAASNCETAGNFAPGQFLPNQGSGQAAVDGRLWWSPSNWDNRMSFPLTFTQPDNICSLTNSAAPTDVYGSELMIQATTQWAPHFCLDPKLFNFDHVQTPEPLARSLLSTNNIEAAFTSQPPDTPYPTPTVQAPTALTGFGIAFEIDDSKLRQVAHLNLDARLLAKLLTMSYPDESYVKTGYSALANNPLNMSYDPEFQALNPGIPEQVIDGAATLQTLSSDSDVIYALTSYINSDADARAWLNGTADPWGMVVNPNYKGMNLPVTSWPLNDTFEPVDVYKPGLNDCLFANPVPYLPLVAAPISRLYNVGQNMEFSISTSQTVCVLPSPIPGSLDGAKMAAVGRQPVGFRFLLGTVSLGDAMREGLTLASLETQKAPGAQDKFTDTTGRTFVAPSNASLQAAAAMLKPDPTTGTWPVPYQQMRTSSGGVNAYPGTTVVYTDVPTKGLPKADATNFANLLHFVAGSGQTPGTNPGNLPDGYLPMTSANGLGTLAAYTNRAADAVAAQNGTVPSLTGSGSVVPTGPNSRSAGSSGGGTSGGSSGRVLPGVGSTTPKNTSTGKTSGASTPSGAGAQPVSYQTQRLGAGIAGAVLPVFGGISLLAVVAAIVLRWRAGGRRA